MRLLLYANASKPRACAARADVAALAEAAGCRVVEDPSAAEVLVSLGGDGTILRAVHEFPGLPVLGLNLGGLGYLATVESREFAAAFRALTEGRYRLSSRTLIACSKRGAAVPLARALNDLVITRELSGHIARLDLAVDGKLATRYLADGLVIATPTGSTAYSLSAGGPVLMPDTESFVITPMNPHALGVRPLVVRDLARIDVTARVRTDGHAERLGVYADGERVFALEPDETAEIRRSEGRVRMIELEGYNPYETLARKLGWSGSNVA